MKLLLQLVTAVAQNVLNWVWTHEQVILATLQSIVSFILLIALSGVLLVTTFNVLYSGILNG